MRKYVIFLLSLASLAACKKPLKTCADPAPGDGPFTAVRGVDLGMSLDQCLRSPNLQPSTWEYDEPWWSDTIWYPDFTHAVTSGKVKGVYEGLEAEYTMLFEDETFLKLTSVNILFTPSADSTAFRSQGNRLLSILRKKYGAPKEEREDSVYPSYAWEICDGAGINLYGYREGFSDSTSKEWLIAVRADFIPVL